MTHRGNSTRRWRTAESILTRNRWTTTQKAAVVLPLQASHSWCSPSGHCSLFTLWTYSRRLPPLSSTAAGWFGVSPPPGTSLHPINVPPLRLFRESRLSIPRTHSSRVVPSRTAPGLLGVRPPPGDLAPNRVWPDPPDAAGTGGGSAYGLSEPQDPVRADDDTLRSTVNGEIELGDGGACAMLTSPTLSARTTAQAARSPYYGTPLRVPKRIISSASLSRSPRAPSVRLLLSRSNPC